MAYLVVNLLAIGVGFIDAAVKAFFNWNALPAFVQGWSWHITMFVLYLVLIWLIGFIRRFTLTQWIGSVLLWINEDVTFYVIKSFVYCNVFWNDWLFGSLWQYAITVVALNITSIVLFNYKRGGEL